MWVNRYCVLWGLFAHESCSGGSPSTAGLSSSWQGPPGTPNSTAAVHSTFIAIGNFVGRNWMKFDLGSLRRVDETHDGEAVAMLAND